jgi:hypothetical protein
MRVTRATSRVEQAQHADDDASTAHSDHDRVPLGDVSANTVLDPEPTDAPPKTTAVKKAKATAKSTAKKGAKGKKVDAAQDADADADAADDVDAAPVAEDEHQAAASPASDAAVDEPADEPTAGACEQHVRHPSRRAANRGV